MKAGLNSVYQCILNGKINEVSSSVQSCLNNGENAEIILHQAMIAAMAEVGRLFEVGEYFVPEMLVAAKTMQTGLDLLRPLLVEVGIKSQGKVVIGTVKGDLHDIGKNLVAMMMEGAGFDVIDLGVNISSGEFVKAVQENQADILAMSALLTTTMPQMHETIKSIQAADLNKEVKVIIGGAPVTADYADEISADGFAPDASQAARLANSLMSSLEKHQVEQHRTEN